MKRYFKAALVFLMILTMMISVQAAAQSVTLQFTDEQLELDPSNQCPVRPQIYSNPRYLNLENESAYDLSNGLSAKQINNSTGTREYGLYFKFTPGGKDHGYYISRFDVVVTDRNGEKLYIDGFDSDLMCEAGYYWAWNFFPLEGLFENLRTLYGEVVPGLYKMDVYFNRLWAGSTTFNIGK